MSRPPKPAERRSLNSRPGFAARAIATALLWAVLDEAMPLDAALESDAQFARIDSRDKAFVRAVVGAALRRLGTIDAVLAVLIERRPPDAGRLLRILEVAAAQVLFMGVADHAAVSVAVDQIAADRHARRFKGLANAVLRRMVRERDALLSGLSSTPELDTPAWLWSRWRDNYGEETARRIAEAHRLEPYLDLSVKRDPEAWAERLGGIVLPAGTVRLIASGSVEDLPGFAEGAWWVQDAAAALPVRLLGDVRGQRVADLCAAPGGKTVALANAGAIVTAVDVSAPRLERLSRNLKRLGLVAETVTADILDWRPPNLFDAVLLDAPCTATGTIRRHPDVAWLKRPGDIATLANLQFRMIERAASILKPGGVLVFCTCSLEPEEGEAHLAAATTRLPLALVPITAAEIGGLAEAVTSTGTLRTLPCHLGRDVRRLSGLDGFFAMRLRKA